MIILASKSPRRAELLAQIGVNFICEASDVDETPEAAELAQDLVLRLAGAKAQTVSAGHGNDAYVLGADTVISIDGQILGKPKDQQDAIAMLKQISGRSHQVMTAVVLIANGKEYKAVVVSDVTFAELSNADLLAYSATDEPYDLSLIHI